MNNKGQTLVLFIILLPVILIMLVLVISLAASSIQKRKIDMVIKNTIEDNMDNLNDIDINKQIDDMLENNLGEFDERNIVIRSDYLEITVRTKISNLFDFITNDDTEIYQVTFVGTGSDKIKIVRRG